MPIPGNLLTTAMAVMPHTNAEAALDAALSLDIPFWPQLPRLNYYEDMYVQASEHFPGIVLDLDKQTLAFSMDKFIGELEETLARFDEPAYFDISTQYSDVYHRFLDLDFSGRPAIRGQLEGPISFGLNVLDQDKRPIIFDDTVRPFLYEFMARRINVQLQRLKKLNANAFMVCNFCSVRCPDTTATPPARTWRNFFQCLSARAGFTCAATRIGIFCSTWTWTSCRWMFI